MSRNPPEKLSTQITDTGHADALKEALAQNKQIRNLAQESVADLSSVNDALKHGLTDQTQLSTIERAVRKNDAVEDKVREVSEKLSVVNRALESEVKHRHILDYRFAALAEQEEAARHAAFHDALTGLPNRALFVDRLEQGFAMAKRHDWTLVVMFLDLDNFKSINDTYGHDVGDTVLKAVGQRLRDNSRGDDTVCRLGGDEFLYLLQEAPDKLTIAAVAEKLINAIRVPCIIKQGDQEISLSVQASIGIAIFPKDGDSSNELVKHADTAMYLAKRKKCGFLFAEADVPVDIEIKNSKSVHNHPPP